MPQLTKDTRILKDPVTGELISVPAAEADRRASDEGLSYATQPEIQKYNERETFGSAGQTAQAAVELAGESATLGLYHASGPEAESRRKILRREHPGIALAAEAAGAVPAIAASAATEGLAGAVGLGARGAAAASAIAEGGVSGFAQEQVQAREEGRDIDAGNIFLYGIGGEIAGRVVPKALGAGLRKVAGRAEEVLGGQADNLLVRAEQRAGAAGSDVAEAAPGPERDRFLRDNAPKIVDDATEQATQGLDRASAAFQDLGDLSTKRDKIKTLVGKAHVGQDEFVVAKTDELESLRSALDGNSVPEGGSPISLAGKDLEDLGAITDPASFRPDSFEGLRGSEEFKTTGRVPKEVDRAGHEKGIRVRMGDGEDAPHLIDGRHRLTVARENDLSHVWGTVYDADGKQIFQGNIPIKDAPSGIDFTSTPGLAGTAKKLQKSIDDAVENINASRVPADRFIALDNAKRVLQRYHVSLGRSRMAAQDAAYHDTLMGIVDSAQESIRKGLEDESLWGRAARFQADVNSAWHNRWFQGAPVTEADLARVTGREFNAKPIIEYDPAKIRSFLQKDKIGRGLTEDKLNSVLEGYQEMAEAHRKWGMTDAKQLDQLQSDVATIRKSLNTADEVGQAKPRADAHDASQAASDQLIRDVVPVVGGPIVAARRMLRNIDTAGKASIGSAANILVNGVRKVAKAADVAGSVGGPIGATAAGHLLQTRQPVDARFQGTYPNLTQSFLAKRQNIVTAMQDPDQLANAMADSLGDLVDAAPDLHLRVTMRMNQAVSYLSQNMPPGVEQSLLSKHASPPDVQAIRTFARLWEAVMDPGAVVQDFATMHATPAQARAIEAVHPDIYARLQNGAIAAVADSPVRPEYERLRYLAQMFDIGAALGGIWKPEVAKNIKNSMQTAPANPEGLSSGSLQTSPTNPRGIASIAAGPTSTG